MILAEGALERVRSPPIPKCIRRINFRERIVLIGPSLSARLGEPELLSRPASLRPHLIRTLSLNAFEMTKYAEQTYIRCTVPVNLLRQPLMCRMASIYAGLALSAFISDGELMKNPDLIVGKSGCRPCYLRAVRCWAGRRAVLMSQGAISAVRFSVKFWPTARQNRSRSRFRIR